MKFYWSQELLKFWDYMVTVFRRHEGFSSFNFVYERFDFTPVEFVQNQSFIIYFANQIFLKSEPLGTFESDILSQTFKRLIKVKPTLSGRK